MSKMNPENHYLKFTLEGMSDPIVYRVSKETSERVTRCFDTMDKFSLETGIEFETLKGRIINVCARYVVMCNVLWDYGRLNPEEEEVHDLILYVSDITEPMRFEKSDPSEMQGIALALQGGAFEQEPFVGFTDQDDEALFLRGDKIMLMNSIDFYPDVEEESAETEETITSNPKLGVRRPGKRAVIE
jgi:hypothetical protein